VGVCRFRRFSKRRRDEPCCRSKGIFRASPTRSLGKAGGTTAFQDASRQSSGAMVRGMKWNGSRSQRWGFRDFTSGRSHHGGTIAEG
jgi:hypothetical protein